MRISTGKKQWLPYLNNFFKGDQGLETWCSSARANIDPTASDHRHGRFCPCVVRIGRFGAYLEAKRVAEDEAKN